MHPSSSCHVPRWVLINHAGEVGVAGDALHSLSVWGGRAEPPHAGRTATGAASWSSTLSIRLCLRDPSRIPLGATFPTHKTATGRKLIHDGKNKTTNQNKPRELQEKSLTVNKRFSGNVSPSFLPWSYEVEWDFFTLFLRIRVSVQSLNFTGDHVHYQNTSSMQTFTLEKKNCFSESIKIYLSSLSFRLSLFHIIKKKTQNPSVFQAKCDDAVFQLELWTEQKWAVVCEFLSQHSILIYSLW